MLMVVAGVVASCMSLEVLLLLNHTDILQCLHFPLSLALLILVDTRMRSRYLQSKSELGPTATDYPADPAADRV